MKDKIQLLMDEAIEKEIQALKNCAPGSEQEAATIKNLTQLHAMRVEEAKIEQADNQRLDDVEVKKAQLKSQAKDRWVNFGVQGVLTIGGWLLYGHFFNKGLEFERTGTVRSPWMRNLISKVLPRK